MKRFLPLMISLVRVLASAALFYGALGLHGDWLLMWLAPLPLLLSRQAPTWRQAAAAAFIAYALGGLAWWPYLSKMAPPVIAAVVILQPALVFALALGLTAYARRKERFVLASLMLPLTFGSYEFLLTKLSPHGSFGSIAYSQSDNLRLMQLLSITGLSGVTFLLCWLPAALATVWWCRHQKAQATRIFAAALLVLLAVIGFGTWRLTATSAVVSIKLALLADDAQLRWYGNADSHGLDSVLDDYVRQVDAAAQHGAQVVVLPEKAITLDPSQVAAVQQRLQQMADRNRISMLVGVNQLGQPKHNLAWLFTPTGTVPASYEKQHLVPGWEANYGVGAVPYLSKLSGMAIGIAICKDMDFPSTLQPYGDVALLLVPAWDFKVDAWMHSRMAMARSIEQGFGMARSAQEGRLTLSDAYGRIVAEASSDATRPVSLIAEFTPVAVPTIYHRYGDWFGWGIVVAWLVSLVCLWRWRKRA